VSGQLDPAWDGLIVQAAGVHRLTWVKQPATGRWRERSETSFYVCQSALSAADFAEAVRAHWTIENRNHHVRDVTLGEDQSRIRVQPGPFTP
jgi:predicted transposase YbfD/YdcC